MKVFNINNKEADNYIKNNKELINLAISLFPKRLRTKEERVSLANIVLLQAREEYNKDKNTSFKTFFLWCYKNAILTEHEKYFNRDIKNIDREVKLTNIPIADEDIVNIRLDVARQLDKLNDLDRNILIGRYFYDKTGKEIGEEIGESQQFVEYREKSTLKWLRDNINNPQAYKPINRNYKEKI